MHRERARQPECSRSTERRPSIATLAVLLAFLMVVPALSLTPSASSDPRLSYNADGKRSLVWDFDNPSNYTAVGTSITSGFGALHLNNDTIVEDREADYSRGLVKSNVDISSVPGSITLPRTTPQIYNVTLQPGPEGVDSYILESSPDYNIGDWRELYLDAWNNKQYRPIVWFDLSSIPSGACVQNATLLLYQRLAKGVDIDMNVYMLTTMFTEMEVTWSSYATGGNWVTPGGDYNPVPICTQMVDSTIGWRSLNVSRLVDLWLSGAAPNYGVVLVPMNSSPQSSTKTFVASDDASRVELRPKLSINYTLAGGVGEYDSMALGPGTNATFTFASWSTSTTNLANDDFNGNSLDTEWTWNNTPLDGGGSFDLGVTKPGWLHIVGEGNTNLQNDDFGSNYLLQNLTGNFKASTLLNTSFTATSMCAGLLMAEDRGNWIGIFLSGYGAGRSILVRFSEGGVSNDVASQAWPAENHAFLMLNRTGSRLEASFSSDGAAWTVLFSYSLPLPYMNMLTVGPCIFSGLAAANPEASWDYFDVSSLGGSIGSVEVSVRAGNSTTPGDTTWMPWGPNLATPSGSTISIVGKYIQYRVVLSMASTWMAPLFSGIRIYDERYSKNGSITTQEQTVANLKTWTSIVTSESTLDGRLWYNYSVNHGVTWKTLGNGGSYSISETSRSMIVRVDITTFNTLLTPYIDFVNATYSINPDRFYIETPATISAGQAFDIVIYAKDENNNTMDYWMGDISLHAMDEAGTTPATSDLSDTFAYIPGGMVLKSSESYNVSETIRVLATSADGSGLSNPIIVTPAPLDHIAIMPSADTIPEFSTQSYTVIGYDMFGNEIQPTSCSWSAESSIGTIANVTSPTVELQTGLGRQEGYLNVTADGMTASLFVHVVPPMYAPEIHGTIPTQAKPEDYGSWTIDISGIVTDFEDGTEALRWYVTGEDVVTAYGENRTGNLNVTLATKKDVWGTNSLRLVVVDSDGMTASTSLEVQISPVNDPPTIDQIAPLVVTAGVGYPYNFRWYVHDVDTSYEDLTLSVDTASKPYALTTWLTITFTYPFSMNGTQNYVVVSVSDGENSSSTAVKITVSDDRVPFSFQRLPDLTMNQSEAVMDYFNLDNYFSDPDAEMLFYAAGYSHIQVTIQANRSVDFTAPTDWWGVEYVVFTATDPDGARAEEGMKVTVLHVNQAPSIDGVPNLRVAYDVRYDFNLAPYMVDPDTAIDALSITTTDAHIAVIGTTLSILFPKAFDGLSIPVNISVSDGDQSDWTVIMITIGDDLPPICLSPPDHSFFEDSEMPYPEVGYVENFFVDPDGAGGELTFSAFSSSADVTVTTNMSALGNWTLMFNTTENYNGISQLTIRATDAEGSIVEDTVTLEIMPVSDPPMITIRPNTMTVQEGKQVALDLSVYVTDPDGPNQVFTYSIDSANDDYAQLRGSVLLLEFQNFLEDEESKDVTITVTVRDETGLMSSDELIVIVTKAQTVPTAGPSQWTYLVIGILAAAASVLLFFVFRMRKKPFVVRDFMLIHNDGFLISRYASHVAGEIDEDILSGMLTAVLNFVEDSTVSEHGALTSFGFKDYNVLVERGGGAFVAVVFEGDAPKETGKSLKEFLGTIERIYKKKLVHWSGDIENDFAGVEVLINAWVKENSKKGQQTAGGIWKIRPSKPKVKPKRVVVSNATNQMTEPEIALSQEGRK